MATNSAKLQSHLKNKNIDMSSTIWEGFVQHQRFNSYTSGKIPCPQFIFNKNRYGVRIDE